MPIDQGPLVLSGIPPQILDVVQSRTWERMFHDALFPELLFRVDAAPREWAAHVGARIAMTRTGLLTVKTTPRNPSTEPSPSSYPIEQWEATAAQYVDGIDTNLREATFALANQFIQNIHTLGLGAGQTLNHIARNQLYSAYLGGETSYDGTEGTPLTLSATAPTSFHVPQLAGFLTMIQVQNNQAIPQALSVSNPLPVVLRAGGTGPVLATAIASTPDNIAYPTGPGTITIAALSIANVLNTGDAVVALNESFRRRIGGGYSDNALTSTSIVTLQDFINSVANLRAFNVPPHSAGVNGQPGDYYHAHISPLTEAEVFADSAWQRALTALPDSFYYRRLALGQVAGIIFLRNTETPSPQSIQPGENFPWPAYNSNGVPIIRDIITGGGVMFEMFINEAKYYISEAGVTGKIGQVVVTANGAQVNVDRVRLILRSPIDRFQELVSGSYSYTGDFPIPSDITSPQVIANPTNIGSNIRYKRAVTLIHA